MPREIPYIDTKVTVERTLAEIEDLLRVHNASHVLKEYESGRIKAVGFKHGGVPFQLPANVDALYSVLLSRRETSTSRVYSVRHPDHTAKAVLYAQAERCAWRNVMAWVKAQLALVEIGMVTVTEVFLPYMLTSSRETLYQRMLAQGLQDVPALGPGDSGEVVEAPK